MENDLRRWMRLIERSSANDVERVAATELMRILAPLGREDMFFRYAANVKEPVQAALQQIALTYGDPEHPLRVYLDFQKSGGTFGEFSEDGIKGLIVLNLLHIIDVTLNLGDPKYESFESVVDLRPVVSVVADVFAHEFLHYRQHLGFWGKDRRKVAKNVERSQPNSPYLSQSVEIHAFAVDAARELRRAFGKNDLIAAIKDGRAKDASPQFRKYAKQGGMVFRNFLKHLSIELNEI